MFYRTAFKWLTITVIVMTAFLVVLLFLGYLLKENEAITTKLKDKLAQEAIQKQAKEARRNNPFDGIALPLSANEKSQQKIIADNQSCDTDKQCFLVHTHSKAIGCIASVNTKGAAILLKVVGQNKNHQTSHLYCQEVYAKQSSLTAQCQQNRCSY